ncbi:MAG TPA: type II secretion system protein GspM [Burkholderiaceae bacterium]|jgi:general secretion pathway protein M|nr:type II secretion system protein GspM [Burkholderiaceae bacterium]
MNAALMLSTLTESATAFWSVRNERQRSMILLGSVALLMLLVYTIFFGPALSGRAKLQLDLPLLRQKAAEIQALSKQAAELKTGGAQDSTPVSQESLTASLSSRSMKPVNLAVSDDSVRVQLNAVSFAGLIEWINDQQKVAHLTVIDATFTALPQNDMVNASVTLKQQKLEE